MSNKLVEVFSNLFRAKEKSMIETKKIVKTHESRWGHYPCDYETYRKLKYINKWYWETIYARADLERWERKEPQNRVIRRWIRNDKRQKIGHEVVGVRPEPKTCPHFGFNDNKFGYDYELARYPAAKELVRPLANSINQINQMYLRCRDWFEDKAQEDAA